MNVSIFAQATAAKSVAYAPIKELLRDLIVSRGATGFYIGDKGYFYMHVVSALRELKYEFPDIICYEVMTSESQPVEFCIGIYPEAVKKAELRCKEEIQIRWMLSKCDIAVVYMNGVKSYYENVIKEAHMVGKEIIDIVL